MGGDCRNHRKYPAGTPNLRLQAKLYMTQLHTTQLNMTDTISYDTIIYDTIMTCSQYLVPWLTLNGLFQILWFHTHQSLVDVAAAIGSVLKLFLNWGSWLVAKQQTAEVGTPSLFTSRKIIDKRGKA